MRQPLIMGNWKMNGSREEGVQLAKALADGLNDPKGIDMFNNQLYVADMDQVVRIDLQGNKTVIAKPSDFQSKPVFLNDIEIDVPRRKVTLRGILLDLTPKEFELLAFLAQNAGIVLSREQLLEKVWGYDFFGGTRTVDVHVRWLRQKIEQDPAEPQRLITVRGAGYKLEG